MPGAPTKGCRGQGQPQGRIAGGTIDAQPRRTSKVNQADGEGITTLSIMRLKTEAIADIPTVAVSATTEGMLSNLAREREANARRTK